FLFPPTFPHFHPLFPVCLHPSLTPAPSSLIATAPPLPFPAPVPSANQRPSPGAPRANRSDARENASAAWRPTAAGASWHWPRPPAREGGVASGPLFPRRHCRHEPPPGGSWGPPPQRNQHLVPARSKSKRLRTKRERNAAKFGPKIPLGGSRRGPGAPPPWLQPPPWGGLALGSPLGPPKPVVITQNRLCHRGLFNREVKSLDVRRLLTPCPGGDCPPPAPQIEEGMVGGVPAEALKELVASLASLLGSFGVFFGRELVSERRRSLVAALRRHRQGLPDLGVFLAHRTAAQPPGTAPTPRRGGRHRRHPLPLSGVVSSAGQETPRAPRQEARPGLPGRVVSLGGWEVGDPPAGTPSPLRAVDTPPPAPRTPSPIFGAPRERETPFSWSSAEDEEDETPGRLTQTWGNGGGLLPGPPPLLAVPTSLPGGGGGGAG
ncbi:LOW QUALITY PROTEIN: proline-rich protein 19, partial [Corvus hawaiiensis]|uniref:LOW QUALITY PROTEIN: proline-rich protein 19 n=1 Tax=Corvus hawaiiensis TaxID=134902 RepID=UPI0020188F42